MIDCHAHLALSDFDNDRGEVILRAQQAGVAKILVVGEDLADNLRVIEICKTYPQTLLAGIGFHPDRFAEDHKAPTRTEIEAVCRLAQENRVAITAIGEVGLDYWSVKTKERRTMQHQCLERMAELAYQLELPLNVHSRSAGHYTLDILAACNARQVLMHAFDGKTGYAQRAAETRGWIFSIPPSIVRSAQKQKLVRALPLESLALESDSPVLGPDPNVRNEPANLIYTVRCIAEIKGINEDVVCEVTTRNARRLFTAQVQSA